MGISKEIEKLICEQFITTKTNELAKKHNICISSIYNILKKYDIKKTTVHKNRKYTLNEHYFEKIDSEDKAYFLGLIYADGNINPDNSTIRLRLQERDKYILEKLNEKCNSNRPLRLNKFKAENWQNSSDLSLSSVKMFNDIQDKGCFINKTFSLKFPTEKQVPIHLQNHFIRGVFDGDGCIYSGKLNAFSIIGTIDLLKEIQKILVKECKLSYNKIPPKHKTNNIICTLRYGGTHYLIRIREYISN